MSRNNSVFTSSFRTPEAGTYFNPAAFYEKLSFDFGKCHQDPVNVAMHFLTTPVGLIGVFSLLRGYTKSSSATMAITFFYLLSLLPVVPNGVFYGTALLCATIGVLSRQLNLSFWPAIACIVLGYMLQVRPEGALCDSFRIHFLI